MTILIKMIGQRLKYLIYSRDVLIGAISFNRAALRVGCRDKWLGWDSETKRRLLPHVVNNNRFLILPWVCVKNLASHILSASIKLMARDWHRLYGVMPYAAETFVDMSRHAGTSYKAANWKYLGETRGFGKAGKAFVYHGRRKGIFVRLLNSMLLSEIARTSKRPLPKPSRTGLWEMMLSKPEWSKELFEEAGINEESVSGLPEKFSAHMDYYSPSFSRSAQQQNAEVYVKGLLSDLDRKSVEPIALLHGDEKMVRTMQQFLKDSPWDDKKMKGLYQSRVVGTYADPEGMLTVDGSDFPKKGSSSAGVARQYCGQTGKVDNCQAGVFIGFSGNKGYGLLDAGLYIPQKWFEDSHKHLWKGCDMEQGEIVFRTKNELAADMINGLDRAHPLPFRWVGCDSAFGRDADFRASLPEGAYLFADLPNTQLVYRERPVWAVPPRTSKYGRTPSAPMPSVPPVPITDIVMDGSIPWSEIVIAEGSKGPVRAKTKICRVIEHVDGKDCDECWLYIRQYANGEIRSSISNAPADIDTSELHKAATLRWPIEQSFEECKSHLGMKDYETRSYVAWHRHMLLVMVAHLFVLEVRFGFLKKTQAASQASY